MVSAAFRLETLTIYVAMSHRNEIKVWVLTKKCDEKTVRTRSDQVHLQL
jgi:hypothetical protein